MSGAATLDAVLGGEIVVLRDEAGIRESWAEIHEQTVQAVGVVAGRGARDQVLQDGLGSLHEVLPAEAIGELRDELMPRVRRALFTTTLRVAREVLGIDHEFYVDDYTILRVNYPYEIALQAPMEAENPGIGRMDPGARADAQQAKVVDPVYNPKGYHREQPPAAWAHGPHLDTWTGHSRGGVNLWWAIGDVVAEHSMFFYPELFGTPLAPDPRSLYLREGRPLPRPTPWPLAAGEMVVFNPEVLHGTHLNVSGLTRVAASTRINAARPAFDPTCFYAREFWHASGDLDEGDLETITRFPRAGNLGPRPYVPSRAEEPPGAPRVEVLSSLDGGAWHDVCDAGLLTGPTGKVMLVGEDGASAWTLCRTAHGIRVVGGRCPHLGTDLADGFHDDAFVYCPAHAVRFSLEDGTSDSPLLRLPVAEARERDGRVEVRVRA
jgi:nitrite reductase/ring-hydroxylating ferredoxin subunit